MLVGFFLIKTGPHLSEYMVSIPYILIGLGSGILGHGTGNLIQKRAMKNNPALQKSMSIDRHDERNIAIANRAKAKAYDCMTFLFASLMLIFAIMRVDTAMILLFVVSYVFVHGYGIYYRIKYDKEM